MLSVQKQPMPSDAPPDSSHPPTATGFAKVLHSIQGLQQRLDDFSVEEVSRAHAKTHTLIRDINHLQVQLDALSKLKDAVINVNAGIAAIPEDNFDLVGPDSLEKHPQLRAIVQAGKLIRMHRVLKAVQASAEPSFHHRASIPSSNTPPIPAEAASDVSPTLEQISGASPAQTPLATSADAKHEIASEADQPPATLENSPVAHDSKATPTYDFADLKLEETQKPGTRRTDDSSQTAARHQDAPSRTSKKAKGKPQINERLLSDLIETYGEFAISTKPPAHRAEVIEMPPPVVEQVASTSTDLVLFEAKPAETAVVKPIASGEPPGRPAPEQERQEPAFDWPSPTIKSHGEIDRQLKSLIKDYGAVDLYSRGKKTLDVKTAIIAAVAGLAVLMGGFYLFKAPSPKTPVAIEATTSGGNSAADVSEPPSSAQQNLKR
jgi:hypothetical protein